MHRMKKRMIAARTARNHATMTGNDRPHPVDPVYPVSARALRILSVSRCLRGEKLIRFLLLFCLMPGLVAHGAGAATLVKDGKARAVIVIGERASAQEKLAADE